MISFNVNNLILMKKSKPKI